MNIAFIGCGYVADFYAQSLRYHGDLTLIGVFDIDQGRATKFASAYRTHAYPSLDSLLADARLELVVNLTNPRSHFEVTRRCLLAGKHVYSEKPLAMTYGTAGELAALATERGLLLASAPSSLLGATAQTMWKALADVSPIRLIYANFDAGMTHRNQPWKWRSATGAPWPAKDEFEVGCTYQHAGYLLTWLAAFFGPATRVTAFASCQLPDKGVALDVQTPDLSIGCIEYRNGIVARLTCSIIAPQDRSLTIIGDHGVLYTRDVRDEASPVYISPTPQPKVQGGLEYRAEYWSAKWERVANRIPWRWGNPWRVRTRYPFAMKPEVRSSGRYKPVDFCRGVSEAASAIREHRQCRLSAALGCHITELIEALQYPERFGGQKQIESTFPPVAPSHTS